MILNYLLVYWTIYATKVNIKLENMLRFSSYKLPHTFFSFLIDCEKVYFSAKGIRGARIRFPFIVVTYYFDIQDRSLRKRCTLEKNGKL